jgi:maltose alpha-D-glucosyltransferase/alpha-amylase
MMNSGIRTQFYQVSVRFKDSNGDGFGDLRGLEEKLPYLHQLGINCIWLMPVYPSPLKDDGYDISDYYNVASTYGNLDDLKSLVRSAHELDIRIIMDLVLNHTSDEHSWFQAARIAISFGSTTSGATLTRNTRLRIIHRHRVIQLTWDEKAEYYWHDSMQASRSEL